VSDPVAIVGHVPETVGKFGGIVPPVLPDEPDELPELEELVPPVELPLVPDEPPPELDVADEDVPLDPPSSPPPSSPPPPELVLSLLDEPPPELAAYPELEAPDEYPELPPPELPPPELVDPEAEPFEPDVEPPELPWGPISPGLDADAHAPMRPSSSATMQRAIADRMTVLQVASRAIRRAEDAWSEHRTLCARNLKCVVVNADFVCDGTFGSRRLQNARGAGKDGG
jgi:hypothetical protein